MKSDKISRLVTENINLIYLVMKRFRNRGVDREDLFHSAFYVMMEWYISVEKYWMMQEKLQLSEKNTE